MKRITSLSRFLFAIAIFLTSTVQVRAQEEASDSPVSIGADMVSRYVFRGLDYRASPSIQPYIEAEFGNFTIGVWGAYTTSSSVENILATQEMDLYATYKITDLITIGVTDYFLPQESDYNYNYFDWNSDSSSHLVEGMISFNGLENLPLSLMVGYLFLNDNDNSIYVELGYSLSILDIFIGAGNGLYLTGDGNFGIMNLGISTGKEIKITDNFSLPVSVSLITNPEAKHIHLVFGISL